MERSKFQQEMAKLENVQELRDFHIQKNKNNYGLKINLKTSRLQLQVSKKDILEKLSIFKVKKNSDLQKLISKRQMQRQYFEVGAI